MVEEQPVEIFHSEFPPSSSTERIPSSLKKASFDHVVALSRDSPSPIAPASKVETERGVDEQESDLDDEDSESFDGEDEAEYEDEEEEELNEPRFKYKRILNDTAKIFNQDNASCFAMHDKFLAIGTQHGNIYVLDHLGNILVDHHGKPKIISAHSISVNKIDIDRNGDYLISCSNDGKVNIYGLGSSEYNQIVSMGRPIRAVAIDDEFSKYGSGQNFATGDRILTIHHRGFFTTDRQQVIFAGRDRDGFIQLISWRGVFVAFANDTGVRVYDRQQKALITHVVREHDLTLRTELFPPHLCWIDARSFVVAWADTITVCGVKENPTHVGAATPDLPSKLVEILYMWELPRYYLCGIGFTTAGGCGPDVVDSGIGLSNSSRLWKELVLFCVCKRPDKDEEDEDSTGEAESPETEGVCSLEKPSFPRVVLVEPKNFSAYETISEDIIEMRDAEKLTCYNYHLQGLAVDNLYFLLSNKDMIEVRPCSADDHVSWLTSNGLFAKALSFAKENATALKADTVGHVGLTYLDSLIQQQQYHDAAQLCPEVCGKRKELWEKYVNVMAEVRQVRLLAPRLPTGNPQLEPESYETVLLDFLEDDVKGFRDLVKDWSPDLYRVGGLIIHTLDKLYSKNLDRETHNALLGTLGQLYTYERNYERALSIYMSLGDRSIFKLIDQYRLFPQVKDKIRELMDIDTDLAVRLLLENEDSLPAATVMRQLMRQPRLQLAYLDKLFNRNEGAEFADLAVSLYAEHDPKRLLPYLRRCEHYKLDKALDVCKSRKLTEEVVFLLARGGNRREALRVIISDQQNIYKAIEFCKEQDDADLWRDLIEFGVRRPEFITILMRNIGTYVDPTLIIRRIPPNMPIPNLRDSLVKILRDYSLQISLQEGCRRVTLDDCHQLVGRLLRVQRRAVRVDEDARCSVCSRSLLCADARFAAAIGHFLCGHVYHDACLEATRLHCLICTTGGGGNTVRAP